MSDAPEHILRQEGKVTRPQWCNCDDGFWMRNLVDPQCYYHSDYGYELRELLTRAADALEEDHEVIKDFFSKATVRDKFLPLIAELRKAAQ